MLDTEVVDDDYFAPVSGTTLANIFGNESQKEQMKNETLKYIPKSENTKKHDSSSPNITECIFACAVLGYEWSQNAYCNRGKIGFAITKNTTHNYHNILLYDLNKVTLSNTRITSNFNVTVKQKIHISYYDDLNKYWSISATEEEVDKIVGLLSKLNICIKDCTHTDEGPPGPNEIGNKVIRLSDKESDTDSLNRKTKASILNRMANMGQSVLPRYTISGEGTSDSSDSNEFNTHSKSVRYRPKTIIKQTFMDKGEQNRQNIAESHEKLVTPQTRPSVGSVPSPLYTNNSQLVPLEKNSIIINPGSNSGADINLLLTEQRISNSEVRINLTRITDKVDKVLDKIEDLGNNTKSYNDTSNFQFEILRKLLSEYENKIKMYEESIAAKKVNNENMKTIEKIPEQNEEFNEIVSYKNKICELEHIIKAKNKDINSLNEKIHVLEMNSLESAKSQTMIELLNEITALKQVLNSNELEVNRKVENQSKPSNTDNNDIENSLKIIMNNAYRTLSANFDNNETYKGDTIKSIIATVIKKVTMNSLSEPQS